MNTQTFERTVNVPSSRRISLTIPDEVPIGPASLIITFCPCKTQARDASNYTPETIEEALTMAETQAADPEVQRLFASLKGTGHQPDGLTGLEEKSKSLNDWPD